MASIADRPWFFGTVFTNGPTPVPTRTPVVRHWYHTICYSRSTAPYDAVIVGRCLSQLRPSHNGTYSMHGQSLVERVYKYFSHLDTYTLCIYSWAVHRDCVLVPVLSLQTEDHDSIGRDQLTRWRMTLYRRLVNHHVLIVTCCSLNQYCLSLSLSLCRVATRLEILEKSRDLKAAGEK